MHSKKNLGSPLRERTRWNGTSILLLPVTDLSHVHNSLISGLNFLVRQIENEVFTYDERRSEPVQFESTKDELFPYLVVNIGSGVSIVKVTSEETYERISGKIPIEWIRIATCMCYSLMT